MTDAMIQVFTKAPELGKVKTRMAREIGEPKALAIYKWLLETVVKTVHQYTLSASDHGVSVSAECRAAGDLQEPFLNRLCLSYGFNILPQNEHIDLGRRMAISAMEGVRTSDCVVIVGGDSVSIDTEYLNQAVLHLMAEFDLVIGPAEDGGYILIGFSSTLDFNTTKALFESVPWGTPSVLESTLNNASQLGLRVHLLETRWDVDRIEDLQRIASDDMPVIL